MGGRVTGHGGRGRTDNERNRGGGARGGLFIARARRGQRVAEEEAQSLQVGPRLFFFSSEIRRLEAEAAAEAEAEAARGGWRRRRPEVETEAARRRQRWPEMETEAARRRRPVAQRSHRRKRRRPETEAAGGTRGTGICEWIDSTRARGE